jgi:hypothetical protein
MMLLLGSAPFCAPEELRSAFSGEIKLRQAPMSADPSANRRGKGDPTSQGWPTKLGILARGARIELFCL